MIGSVSLSTLTIISRITFEIYLTNKKSRKNVNKLIYKKPKKLSNFTN